MGKKNGLKIKSSANETSFEKRLCELKDEPKKIDSRVERQKNGGFRRDLERTVRRSSWNPRRRRAEGNVAGGEICD